MASKSSGKKPIRVVLDTNVIYALHEGKGGVEGTLAHLRAIVSEGHFLELAVTQTVLAEIDHHAETASHRMHKVANAVLDSDTLAKHEIGVLYMDVSDDLTVSKAVAAVRKAGVMDANERNDMRIICQSGVKRAFILTTNDSDMLDINTDKLFGHLRKEKVHTPRIIKVGDLLALKKLP